MNGSVKMRQEVERKIARAFVKEALAQGYEISVFDCEEVPLERSRNLKAILAAMFTTDDDRLYLYKPDAKRMVYHDCKGSHPGDCDGCTLAKEKWGKPVKFAPEYIDPNWFGWCWFVYGNDGWDVISDHTCNLDPIMGPATKVSEKYQ